MSNDYQYVFHIDLPNGQKSTLVFGPWSSLDDVRQRLFQLSSALADSFRQSKKVEFSLYNLTENPTTTPSPSNATQAAAAERSLAPKASSPFLASTTDQKLQSSPRKFPAPLTPKTAQYPLQHSQPAASPTTSPRPATPNFTNSSSPTQFRPPTGSGASPSLTSSAGPSLHVTRRRSKSFDRIPISPVVSESAIESNKQRNASISSAPKPMVQVVGGSRDRSASSASPSSRSSTISGHRMGLVRNLTASPRESSAASPVVEVLEVSTPTTRLDQSRPRSFNWNSIPSKVASKVIVNPAALAELKARLSPNLVSLGISYQEVSPEAILFTQTVSAIAQNVRQTGAMELDVSPASVSNTPLPSWFPQDEFRIAIRGSLLVPDSKEIFCRTTDTSTSLLQRLLPDKGAQHQQYVLKVCGFHEYVNDSTVVLSNLVCVRDCLKSRRVPEFSILTRTSSLTEGLEAIKAARKASEDNAWLEAQLLGPKTSIESQCYLVNSIEKWFEVKIVALDGFKPDALLDPSSSPDAVTIDELKSISEPSGLQLFVEATVCVTGFVADSLRTSSRSIPMWAEWLRSERVSWSNLPREARIQFQLYLVRPDRSRSKALPLGKAQFVLFDRLGFLKTGPHRLKLWTPSDPAVAKSVFCPVSENPSASGLTLHFEIESPPSGYLVLHDAPERVTRAPPVQILRPDKAIQEKIERLCLYDPMQQLSPAEKIMMWQHRYWVQAAALPNSLVRIAESTNLFDPSASRELHYIVNSWGPLAAGEAIELLGLQVSNIQVRRFAVRCLHALDDDALALLLLQLVHALEFENYHDSDLARFLMERALRNRTGIGQRLFWHLVASISERTVARYGLYLEAYLNNCSDQLPRLVYQRQVFSTLKSIAQQVSAATTKAKKNSILQAELSNLSPLSRSLVMPHRPTLLAQRLVVEKCRYMDSAASPLWLVFENTDTASEDMSTFSIIFKAGDDLRQDILILQMLSCMDSYWKQEGMDLFMTVYGCVATGPQDGIIEVVPRATTVGRIQKEFGGATAAFSKEPLSRWLATMNTGVKDLSDAIDHFTMSLAGFCVASFLLGFADRHNDNIMICESGNFFHIDFAQYALYKSVFLGHSRKHPLMLNLLLISHCSILGHFLSFGPYQRESAPFVLTPEFIEAMGGSDSRNFERFCQTCTKAYNICRKRSLDLIRLFKLMITTDLPQLQNKNDASKGLPYLHLAFAIDMSPEEAAKKFEALISESRTNLKTTINFFFHSLVH